MQQQASPEENPAIGMTPAVVPRAHWRVVDVKALENFRLWVGFADGTEGEVNMSKLIHATEPGVFADLNKPDVFARVRVELGVVSWPNGQDLAPDAMYEAIRERGIWEPA